MVVALNNPTAKVCIELTCKVNGAHKLTYTWWMIAQNIRLYPFLVDNGRVHCAGDGVV